MSDMTTIIFFLFSLRKFDSIKKIFDSFTAPASLFFLSSFFSLHLSFSFLSTHIVKMGVFFREQNYKILPSNCRRRRRKQTVENKKSMHVQTSILYIYLFSFVVIRSSTMKNMNKMKTISTRSLILQQWGKASSSSSLSFPLPLSPSLSLSLSLSLRANRSIIM